MPDGTDFRTYHISGNDIDTDGSPEEKESLLQSVRFLEEQAREIGQALGMTSLNLCAMTMEDGSLAYRHAVSSEEDFEFRGVATQSQVSPGELLKQL